MTDAPAKIQFGSRRSVDEWVGATPDTPIPDRVKLRVFERQEGRCAITGKKLGVGETDYDHIVRLRDWTGEGHGNRETNLQAVWRPAHREKSAREHSEGTKADRIRAKHLGIAPPPTQKLKSRNTFKRRWG